MRLKWLVVLTVVGVQFAAAALVIGVTRQAVSDGIAENARVSMRHLGRAASDSFRLFLAPAEHASRLLHSMVGEGRFDWGDAERVERFMIEPLRIAPSIDSLYFGSTAGDFLFVTRDLERSGYLVKQIRHAGGERQVVFRRLDAGGRSMEVWQDPKDRFDPRVRPWFSAAIETDAALWTSPYVFYTSRQPGVSTAVAILNADRSQWGAIGADIGLSTFGDRLSDLSNRTEATFVVDRDGAVVAIPDRPDRWPGLFETDELSGRLAVASTGFGPLVRATPRDGRQFGEIETARGRYWVDLQPMDGNASPWLMAVAVPADSLFTWASSLRDRVVALTLGMAVVAVSLTLLAWRFGVEGPVRAVDARLRRIAEGRWEPSPVLSGPAEFREIDAAASEAGRRIQDREAANRRLVDMLREYELAVQQAPVGIAILEPDGRIVFANGTYRRTVGPEDPLGGLPRVFPDGDAAGLAARMDTVRSGRTLREDLTLASVGDGVPAVLQVMLSPLSSDAGPNGGRAVLLVEDVTARKRVETGLVEARDAAERSDRAKSAFLAQMSHELRTPLNAIIGFSEVIRSEIFGAIGSVRYSEYVGNIATSANHLKDLIERILDVSRIEQGGLDLAPREVEMVVSVREALDMLATTAADAGVALALQLDAGRPPPQSIVADPSAIRQIVANLVANAVRFSPRGSTVSVTLGGTPDDGAEIVVADRGVGIPTQDLSHVFEPFWQGASAWSSERVGVGLGLSIVRMLVELHHGSVEIDSAPGEGTRVTVRLPNGRPEE